MRKLPSQILINGAGPTGLMFACQLAIRNIPFRIIDKNKDHTTQSRALVIHARSLEIFQHLGIAMKAIEQGQKAKALGAIFNGKKLFRVEIEAVGEGLTKFPYLLMLEQSKTEKILSDFLKTYGYRVERQVELIDFEEDDTTVTATIKHANGEEELVQVSYLVGADGAHSIVRHKLQIPFGGKTYQQSLFVLDCKIKEKEQFPADEMYFAFSGDTLAGFFPLTNGRFRVLGLIPLELLNKKTLTFEDVAPNFAKRIKLDVTLYDPQWISAYHAHHRYASTFRKGRSFLIGDAAHIHSPVGAQGMNTGLQDAYNLAWKLALVIEGRARNELLDTYTEERIAIAKRLVKTTDRVFNFAAGMGVFVKLARLYVLPFVLKVILPILATKKFFRQLAFKTISEIGIEYRASSLSHKATAGNFPVYAPQPGDRLPYVEYTNLDGSRINIQSKIHPTRFQLFLFSGKNNVEIETGSIIKQYKKIISIEVIPLAQGTENLYRVFGIEQKGYYLVRPDMYIAHREQSMDISLMKEYFNKFLISKIG